MKWYRVLTGGTWHPVTRNNRKIYCRYEECTEVERIEGRQGPLARKKESYGERFSRSFWGPKTTFGFRKTVAKELGSAFRTITGTLTGRVWYKVTSKKNPARTYWTLIRPRDPERIRRIKRRSRFGYIR